MDGKPVPLGPGAQLRPNAGGYEPQFTADGKHWFIKTSGTGGVQQLIADGKPWMKAQNAQLHMAPVGSGVVAVVIQGVPGGGGVQFLHVGGKKVLGSECNGPGGISKVYFSADGAHYAALCQTQAYTQFLLVDGKKGQEYQSIDNFFFTPDGKHIFWLGRPLTSPRQEIFLDGKSVAQIDAPAIASVPGWWDMGADGVLTVFANDGAMMKRIRITPGADSSIETMLGKAKELRER